MLINLRNPMLSLAAVAAVFSLSACAESEGPVESGSTGPRASQEVAEALTALSGADGLDAVILEDQARRTALSGLPQTPDAVYLRGILLDAGCALDPEAAVVLELGDGEGGAALLTTEPAKCEDGSQGAFYTLKHGDVLAIYAQKVQLDEQRVVAVETFEVQDGALLYDAIDPMAEALSADVACSAEVPELGCEASGLFGIDRCWICQRAAGFLIGQGRRACGWAGAAACGALGLAGGVPGVVCAGATWAICRLGIRSARQRGSRWACTQTGFCQ